MYSTVQDNGYKAEALQNMKAKWEKAGSKLFAVCKAVHFYYGDKLDMVTLYLDNGDYAHYNIREDGVTFTGNHSSSDSVYERFCQLTHNDPLFDGKVEELAR